MHKALTENEIEQLRRIRHKYTIDQLCDMFFVSDYVIKKACKDMNIKKRRPPLEARSIDRMQKYRRYGWSLYKIAKITGHNIRTVNKYCRDIKELGKDYEKLPAYKWQNGRMEVAK
jgi:DNA-binding CsgD family transcriptional regulator